jgi:hypothetical protein
MLALRHTNETMKHIKKLLILAASFLIFSVMIANNANAGLLYNYSQLSLKDLDQMSKLVQNKINESRKAGGDQVIPLKEALQAVYSRSNEDFLIEKILSPLKTELDEHEAWDSSLKALTKEALGALKNPKAFKPVVQVTYLVFLENLISEVKPHATDKFERSLLEDVIKANIKVTKEAENERRLRVMKSTISPSVIAENVLKAADEEAKKAAEVKK